MTMGEERLVKRVAIFIRILKKLRWDTADQAAGGSVEMERLEKGGENVTVERWRM